MYDGELAASGSHASAAVLGFTVEALSLSASHGFGKTACERLELIAGLGVEGDAHCGALDQHIHRGKPDAPSNLRQLHLFAGELMDVLREEGFALSPGAIGENVTTRGVDLLRLPLDTVVRFPSGAQARLTGRRTPCRLVDRLGRGLMKRLMGDGAWGERPIAGVMAVIVQGGGVHVDDRVAVSVPSGPLRELPAL